MVNIDQTGITTVDKISRIIGSKGVNYDGAATSGEKYKHYSVLLHEGNWFVYITGFYLLQNANFICFRTG